MQIITTVGIKQQPVARAIFCCRPLRDDGIPVAVDILRFAADNPVALFQLNDTPGMPFRLLILNLH
jgi:hypothetical protein